MPLRDLILKDLWLKLASLVAAVFIWLTVSAAIRKEGDQANYSLAGLKLRTFHDLPVLVVSTAADVRSFQVSPNRVDVTVRGDTEALTRLRAKDVHVSVDLTGVESAADLKKRVEVSTPPGIMHERIEPETVDVVIPPKP